MTLKKIILLLLVNLVSITLFSQVELQNGSARFSYPVYSFSDNLSRLTLAIALNYSSENGLQVDRVPSAIGANWSLTGVPAIIRLQKGQPDDQILREDDIDNLNNYPPGVLYSTAAISAGCPNSLLYYPLFGARQQKYAERNRTTADRELDYFKLILGTRSIIFILKGKQGLQENAIVLNDNRVQIKAFANGRSDSCRTSITRFEVTDENGVLYEFSEKEYSRVFRYSSMYEDYPTFPVNNTAWQSAKDIPLSESPYVVTGWYASRIKDTKANREIRFSYATQRLTYENITGLQAKTPSVFGGYGTDNNPSGPCFSCISTKRSEVSGIIRKTDISKKEIQGITFPGNETLDFEYEMERKDVKGGYALTRITLTGIDREQLRQIKLNQGFFVKNDIKSKSAVTVQEEKWSRLCLNSIQKTGRLDSDTEPPFRFTYYQGTDNVEDFVPPIFFHAKDPWGYYNGTNCGLPVNQILNPRTTSVEDWFRLCVYNQGHNYVGGTQEIIPTNKNGYAKNGLLKNIKTPYGGLTEYEYVQNKGNLQGYFNPEDQVVGGVSVSRVIESTVENPVKQITEYKYLMPDGSSSLWGVEQPKCERIEKSYFNTEGKFFNESGCDYLYKYPGYANIGKHGELQNLYSELMRVRKIGMTYSRVIDHFYKRDFVEAVTGILNYLTGIAISCGESNVQQITKYAYSFTPLNFSNVLPTQYRRVEVEKYASNGLHSGRSIHTFTSDEDFPPLLPINMYQKHFFSQGQRCLDWMYGLPKSVLNYNNNNQVVSSLENRYAQQLSRDGTDNLTLSCNCEPTYSGSLNKPDWLSESTYSNTSIPDKLKVDFYNIKTGRALLTQTTEKVFDISGNVMTAQTMYTYNPKNYLCSGKVSIDYSGKKVELKTYYPEDYDLSLPANSVLAQLVEQNRVELPVSTEVWQTKPGGSSELISSTVAEFSVIINGDIKGTRSYALITGKPVPLSDIGNFNPALLIRNGSLIRPTAEITFDSSGLPIQTKDTRTNKSGCVFFDYDRQYPVAEVSNALKNEAGFTSFESLEKGNWNYDTARVVTEYCPTGKKCYQLGMNPIFKVTANVTIGKPYTLSFWASSADFMINGNTVIPTITEGPINGWTYYQFYFAPGTPAPVITGSCRIDELRLYPQQANMTTYTYDPGLGKTSVCDINNRISYFEYDGLGRISKERDERKNVIKVYEYHFKQD